MQGLLRPADLQRYKRRLLEKQREVSSAKPDAQAWVPGAGGWEGDLVDQANADAKPELQIRLHETDWRLLRAIEEALARLKLMGDADVNILGFLLTTSGTKGYVKLIVDDVDKAKEALDDEGLPYAEQVVLHAKLANVPGALGRFAGKLAARKINIISGYHTIEKDSKKASVVLEVPNGRQIRWSQRKGVCAPPHDCIRGRDVARKPEKDWPGELTFVLNHWVVDRRRYQ